MKHIHCPVNGWSCPYYKFKGTGELSGEECLCTLESPLEDCDDFYAVFGDCDPEDYTDDTEEEQK